MVGLDYSCLVCIHPSIGLIAHYNAITHRFTILACILLIFPRLLLFLSTPYNIHAAEIRETMTPLEGYLCTHVGIGLFALAIALVTSVRLPPLPPSLQVLIHPH